MAMTNGEYTQEGIQGVQFTRLMQEYNDLTNEGLELEASMNYHYENGDMYYAFIDASDLGVIQIQLQLLQAEVNRRDNEDGPLTGEEARETFDELMNILAQNMGGKD